MGYWESGSGIWAILIFSRRLWVLDGGTIGRGGKGIYQIRARGVIGDRKMCSMNDISFIICSPN